MRPPASAATGVGGRSVEYSGDDAVFAYLERHRRRTFAADQGPKVLLTSKLSCFQTGTHMLNLIKISAQSLDLIRVWPVISLDTQGVDCRLKLLMARPQTIKRVRLFALRSPRTSGGS